MTATTFDASFQDKILTLAIRDTPFLERVDGLLEPKYFDAETTRYLINLTTKHFEKYRTAPDATIIIKTIKDAKAATLLKDEFVDDLKPLIRKVFSPTADLSNRDFYVDEVGKFARQRAMEAAISDSIDILESGGDFTQIDAKISAAQAVGALGGTASRDFFDTIEDRTDARLALSSSTSPRGITTGHREIDNILYHQGWGKKELVILMGGAKAGKSLGLAHFAINAVREGYKVLYTTHENSADVTLARMDAAIADVELSKVDINFTSVRAAGAKLKAKGGVFKIEEFPAGVAKVSDLRRLVQRYAAQGIKFDMLVCDYADELAPERLREEERHELSEIYRSLRALATQEDLAVITATQTNRAGNKANTVYATDVAEDFSKMRIADLVLTINANEDEKKADVLRLYVALSRNSQQGMMIHCASNRSRMQFIKKVVSVS